MEKTRRLVSRALEARAAAKIRVRQPLGKLAVSEKDMPPSKDRAALLSIIADEVNIENVMVSNDLAAGEIKLDTTLTQELREEGFVRDAIREIQAYRKEQKLRPGELATYRKKEKVSPKYADIIAKNKDQIQHTTHTTIELTVDESFKDLRSD